MSRRQHPEYLADYFTKQFSFYFQTLWLDKGKSKSDFLRALKEVRDDGSEPTYGHLRKWLNGTFPEDYFMDIATVLGVKPSLLVGFGFPDYDVAVENDYDAKRFEYARKIGLDIHFMLFILNLFSGADFYLIKTYDYLDDLLDGEEDFDDLDELLLPEDIAKDIQCKFRGTISFARDKKDGIPVLGNYGLESDHFSLPCKRDLLYMKILQDKYSSFLRIEVKDLVKTITANVRPKTKEEVDRQLIRQHKKGQKSNNIRRESEGEPKITLAEYIVRKDGGYVDFDEALKETSDWLKNRDEDPNQIN